MNVLQINYSPDAVKEKKDWLNATMFCTTKPSPQGGGVHLLPAGCICSDNILFCCIFSFAKGQWFTWMSHMCLPDDKYKWFPWLSVLIELLDPISKNRRGVIKHVFISITFLCSHTFFCMFIHYCVVIHTHNHTCVSTVLGCLVWWQILCVNSHNPLKHTLIMSLSSDIITIGCKTF